MILIILSRRIKQRSIRLERLFVLNLRSRDIKAQVDGHKKPLYEGHLLDRDVHISDFEIPENSVWAGKTLRELRFRNRFGIHVSSILRGIIRINIPNGENVIFPGDKIQAIGSDEQLTAFSAAMRNDVYDEDPDIEKREMKLRQIIISENSPIIGKTLIESGIRDIYNCMVVGLEERKENLSQIEPSHVMQQGDVIWVVGEEESLDRLTEAAYGK